ncbi:MAG: recombinase family protein, partial [Pseudomonadota bacterium]
MTQPENPQHAVLYCRVSSLKQVDEGHGLDSQETRCREYAKRKGYEVVAVFADKGVSGGTLDRPQMRQLLSFLLAQPQPNTVVIVDDLNRFSRDVRVHWQLRELVKNAGGLLESPSMKFGDTSDDKLIENLLASVSQHQREKNGEQVVNRMRARVQNGYAVTAKVIGYRYEQTKTEGKVLVRDEPVASIVAEALEGFASGRFATQSEVQRFLESQPDFPKQNHGGIRLQKVTDILKHPIYAGYVHSKAWNVSLRKGRHEGLISFETHKAIQDRLEQKAYAPTRKDISEDFPLRGFVTCGDCNKPLTSGWSRSCTGKRYAYYLCQNKQCDSYGKSIRRDTIEGEFTTVLKAMKPSQGLFDLVKVMITDAWDQRAAQANETSKALKRQIRTIDEQIDGFLKRLADASSPAAIKAYERKIEQLEGEKLLTAEKLE